jgi:hypothetical protein
MKNPQYWSEFTSRFHDMISVSQDHMNIANMLIQNTWDDITNIMMYGSVGFPYPQFVDYILTKKFGAFNKTKCVFAKTMVYYETPYYFEIDMLHPDNKKAMDELQEFVKFITSSKCIHMNSKHVIVIHNIHEIKDKYAFRVLLERFSHNALFIGITTHFASIEMPLQSRFFNIRVRLFTVDEIRRMFEILGHKFEPSSRNIYRQIALLSDPELHRQLYYPPISELFQKGTPSILDVRKVAYKCCQLNIPFHLIVSDLLQFISDTDKHWFISKAANIEHSLASTNKGRDALYFESLFQHAVYVKYVKKEM